MDISSINFNSDGLVPVIAQDARTGEVLMQAYASAEALKQTLATGYAHYYSRSRKVLWKKGEQSGHLQRVLQVVTDCDCDSILYKVEQIGGLACHTNKPSCFFNVISGEQPANSSILYEDASAIKQRRACPQEGSYVNYLLEKGVDKICKKIGEEASEVIISAKTEGHADLAMELADLYFHTLVLLEALDTPIDEVFEVLTARRNSKRKREY